MKAPDDGQGFLFGSSDPCPGRSITACQDRPGETCGCRWALSHTGPHICVNCNQVIRAATLTKSAAVLFSPALDPAIDKPRARARDPDTSRSAAAKLSPYLGKIQAVVIDAFRDHGAMNDPELEEAVRGDGYDYAYSTARKRRGELEGEGIVRATGEIRHADERNSFGTGTSDSIVHELVNDWRERVAALGKSFPRQPRRKKVPA